jgi:hypothetical protein
MVYGISGDNYRIKRRCCFPSLRQSIEKLCFQGEGMRRRKSFYLFINNKDTGIYSAKKTLTFRRFVAILYTWTPSGMDVERRKDRHAVADQRPIFFV